MLRSCCSKSGRCEILSTEALSVLLVFWLAGSGTALSSEHHHYSSRLNDQSDDVDVQDIRSIAQGYKICIILD